MIEVGDCVEVMAAMPAASVDAIVTDPPYGLSVEPDAAEVLRHWLAGDDYTHRGGGFMGRDWDSFVPGPAVWREALRVLKPGGYLLAFFGTRTVDLGAMAIRLAGFERRDTIAWLYGSGFPKSHNLPDGRGTALKPAHEPVVMARKPLTGTVAGNVQAHGTGALNIDAARIATTDKLGGGAELDVQSDKPDGWDRPWRNDPGAQAAHAARVRANVERAETLGRWPANVVLDPEAAALLDEQSGTLTSGANPTRRGSDKFRLAYGEFEGQRECVPARGVDSGGASRFFYCAKADTAERNAGLGDDLSLFSPASGAPARNDHPTVKPIALMRWLCRLVTPPGGLVLDPFAGSGTTGCAAALEGFRFVGIERDPEYAAIAGARIAHTGCAT